MTANNSSHEWVADIKSEDGTHVIAEVSVPLGSLWHIQDMLDENPEVLKTLRIRRKPEPLQAQEVSRG